MDRELVREMFYHGYDNYLEHAYPDDELKPISCTGRRRDGKNPRGDMDDTLGDYSLTLVDAMDTLVLLGDYAEFIKAVEMAEMVSFNRDVNISMFEVTIRMLGGLLSSHLFAQRLSDETKLPVSAERPLFNYQKKLARQILEKVPPSHRNTHQLSLLQQAEEQALGKVWEYHGQLLHKAEDLGKRLLPGFFSKTGIPYSRVNLQTGPLHKLTHNCLAGAGTLLLEFGSLAKLTGYNLYHTPALNAMKVLCEKRNHLNLLANTIDVQSGVFVDTTSHIGAGGDSFYEYLLKASILFYDPVLAKCFDTTYKAIERHMCDTTTYYYHPVGTINGQYQRRSVDSLQAFWPGLQVLTGDLARAIRGHYALWRIWKRVGFLPEMYYTDSDKVMRNQDDWPLRPEFIESTYFLYSATRHPFYLAVGRVIVEQIEKHCKVECGYASIGSIDHRKDDRMDSFFLSETVKYLYLLFDSPSHWMDNENYLFTTEGHPLPVDLLKTSLNGPKNFKYCSQMTDEDRQLLDKIYAADFPKRLEGDSFVSEPTHDDDDNDVKNNNNNNENNNTKNNSDNDDNNTEQWDIVVSFLTEYVELRFPDTDGSDDGNRNDSPLVIASLASQSKQAFISTFPDPNTPYRFVSLLHSVTSPSRLTQDSETKDDAPSAQTVNRIRDEEGKSADDIDDESGQDSANHSVRGSIVVQLVVSEQRLVHEVLALQKRGALGVVFVDTTGDNDDNGLSTALTTLDPLHQVKIPVLLVTETPIEDLFASEDALVELEGFLTLHEEPYARISGDLKNAAPEQLSSLMAQIQAWKTYFIQPPSSSATPSPSTILESDLSTPSPSSSPSPLSVESPSTVAAKVSSVNEPTTSPQPSDSTTDTNILAEESSPDVLVTKEVDHQTKLPCSHSADIVLDTTVCESAGASTASKENALSAHNNGEAHELLVVDHVSQRVLVDSEAVSDEVDICADDHCSSLAPADE